MVVGVLVYLVAVLTMEVNYFCLAVYRRWRRHVTNMTIDTLPCCGRGCPSHDALLHGTMAVVVVTAVFGQAASITLVATIGLPARPAPHGRHGLPLLIVFVNIVIFVVVIMHWTGE